MPRFQIIPTDRPDEIIEIEGVDAGSALHIANQLSCDQADVHRNGAYLFSVRTLGGKASFWEIFQRPVSHPTVTENS